MNTDLYIYVNTNVCYKINMFAYPVVETIKNIGIMKVGGEKELGTQWTRTCVMSHRGRRLCH